MADELVHGYRDAAPPPAERFALRMGGAARIGVVVGLGAIALTVAVWLLTGRLFLLLFVAVGPGLFYVLSGAPRAIEVRHDEVVVRSWLRSPRRLPVSELQVQHSDEELVLVSAEHTIAIAIEHFPDGTLERFMHTIRARLLHH